MELDVRSDVDMDEAQIMEIEREIQQIQLDDREDIELDDDEFRQIDEEIRTIPWVMP